MDELTVEIPISQAICSMPIPLGGISSTLTPFTGNQWNESWQWDRNAVKGLPPNAQLELWNMLKDLAGT